MIPIPAGEGHPDVSAGNLLGTVLYFVLFNPPRDRVPVIWGLAEDGWTVVNKVEVGHDSPDAAPASNEVPSLEAARYWFDQYCCAAGWEARLIRDIRQLSSGGAPRPQDNPPRRRPE